MVVVVGGQVCVCVRERLLCFGEGVLGVSFDHMVPHCVSGVLLLSI